MKLNGRLDYIGGLGTIIINSIPKCPGWQGCWELDSVAAYHCGGIWHSDIVEWNPTLVSPLDPNVLRAGVNIAAWSAAHNNDIGTQSLVMGHLATERKSIELRREEPDTAKTSENENGGEELLARGDRLQAAKHPPDHIVHPFNAGRRDQKHDDA